MNDAAILTYMIFWCVVLLFLCTVERGAFRYYRGKKKERRKKLITAYNFKKSYSYDHNYGCDCNYNYFFRHAGQIFIVLQP